MPGQTLKDDSSSKPSGDGHAAFKKLRNLSLFFALVALLIWMGLNASGFFWSSLSIPRDQQVFDTFAENSLLNSPWLDAALIARSPSEKGTIQIVPYENLEEFKKINPDCCSFKELESGHHPSDIERLALSIDFHFTTFGSAWPSTTFAIASK